MSVSPDLQSIMDFETRKYAVQKVIFCPCTHEVMDVKTAVLIENQEATKVMGIISANGWKQVGAAFMEKFPTARVTNAPKGSPGFVDG